MKQVQRGFTLIELVMVIVILGILAAVAIPKFVDLSSQARLSAVQGVAGGLSSASAINVAGCAVNGNTLVNGKCIPMSEASKKCADVGTDLLNPTITITPVASLPGTTTAGTYYITDANNLFLTTGGVDCNFVLGDGSATGVAGKFVGYATGS